MQSFRAALKFVTSWEYLLVASLIYRLMALKFCAPNAVKCLQMWREMSSGVPCGRGTSAAWRKKIILRWSVVSVCTFYMIQKKKTNSTSFSSWTCVSISSRAWNLMLPPMENPWISSKEACVVCPPSKLIYLFLEMKMDLSNYLKLSFWNLAVKSKWRENCLHSCLCAGLNREKWKALQSTWNCCVWQNITSSNLLTSQKGKNCVYLVNT